MDIPIPSLALVFVCIVTPSETTIWDSNSLSRPVITRNHRRLKGFAFNTFRSISLVSCGLQCQRNPRCVSTNFRKVSSFGETEGICELNDRGVLLSVEGEELEFDEEAVYTQFYDMKPDCQLTGCLNDGSCIFSLSLQTFSCKCNDHWVGSYCEACATPLGMESGVIRDSQISASSIWDGNHTAHQARLHFKAKGVKRGGWSSLHNDQNQWLQVDLQQTKKVTRIATQGRNRYSQWVTKYKLQYGDDGRNFKFYKRYGDHSDVVFPGNKDRDSVVYHQVNPVIEARYIRVRPTEWYGHISMRMELYSC